MALEIQTEPDIFIVRGDNHTITVTFSDTDITGATVFFTVKSAIDAAADDSAASITKDVTSHSDPTNGVTLISLSNSDTNITPGLYYYDIQLKTAGGSIVSVPPRRLEIISDVTRRTS